ncbi:hypothetical protein [Burkholderia gladioli]|uniref:hypothetical protein n=1 Tax=Burkholderia gladioli TaxID=28095 RepID=UPI00164084E1|nr:hypothetical protein [Burkholderia gladioli]
MTDPAAGATTSKVAEMITGALGRLVDARMFVLGMTFLWYLDIWAMYSGIDPTSITFSDVLDHLKATPVSTFVGCIGLYSFLMALVVPGIRYVWVTVMSIYGPRGNESRPLADDERELSNWAFFLVVAVVVDFCKGYATRGAYDGLSGYLIGLFSGEGFAIYLLGCAVCLSFLGCVILAFQYER